MDVQLSPSVSAVRPLRLARSRDRRPAGAAAAVGRRGQRQHLRAQQAAGARRDLRAERPRRCSKCGSAGRPRRAARTRRRSAPTSALDAFGIAGLPTDRAHRRRPADAADHRLLRSRPAGDQPAVAVPDGLEPEGELHVAARPAVAEGRLRVPAHRTSRCRTSTRSTAATPTPASSRGRPASPPTTSTTSPTSCSACARSTR